MARFYVNHPTRRVSIHLTGCGHANRSTHQNMTEHGYWSEEDQLHLVRINAQIIAQRMGYTLEECEDCHL